MIGYPLSDCQLLMLSNLSCRYDNILMSFFVKSFITLPILLGFKPNLVP